jgi:hypothetical protein
MTPEEMQDALERAVKTIANQHRTITTLKDRLSTIRYQWNVALKSLEKIAEELSKGET